MRVDVEAKIGRITKDESADFVRRLVHFVCALLATGDPRPGPLSDHLDVIAAAAAGWDHNRGGVFVD